MKRILESPRGTKPYSDSQWSAIDTLGRRVDEVLADNDVRLTIGGEPTFVSVDDMEGEEWNTAAAGKNKHVLATTLITRLRDRFAPHGLLHFGQGKWYTGESLPRWSFSHFLREDDEPLWREPELVAGDVGGEPKLALFSFREAGLAQIPEIGILYVVADRGDRPAY